MSHGARNWPFFTFTTRPVSAAATSRSVWRQRKAGICSTSAACATCRALRRLVHVGEHRDFSVSRISAKIGSAALEPDAARARPAGAVRLVERGLVDEPDADASRDLLQRGGHFQRVLRGSRARTGPRSARAAMHCRNARCRRSRWGLARTSGDLAQPGCRRSTRASASGRAVAE